MTIHSWYEHIISFVCTLTLNSFFKKMNLKISLCSHVIVWCTFIKIGNKLMSFYSSLTWRGNVPWSDSSLNLLKGRKDSLDPLMIDSSEPLAGTTSLWSPNLQVKTWILAFACLSLASLPSCSANSREFLFAANICSKSGDKIMQRGYRPVDQVGRRQ